MANNYQPDSLTQRSEETSRENARMNKSGHALMLICCIAMVAGAGVYLWSLEPGTSWTQQFIALLPVAGCLGAHFLMHRFMGHASHKDSKGKDNE